MSAGLDPEYLINSLFILVKDDNFLCLLAWISVELFLAILYNSKLLL